MSEINRVMGLGFDMFTISPEETIEHDYRCAFHKIVPDDEPISSDFCDDPVRFGIARMEDEDMAVMCHAHFQWFAADMVEACIILADEDTLAEGPKVTVNTKLKEAATKHAIMNLAASIKRQKEGANQ